MMARNNKQINKQKPNPSLQGRVRFGEQRRETEKKNIHLSPTGVWIWSSLGHSHGGCDQNTRWMFTVSPWNVGGPFSLEFCVQHVFCFAVKSGKKQQRCQQNCIQNPRLHRVFILWFYFKSTDGIMNRANGSHKVMNTIFIGKIKLLKQPRLIFSCEKIM